MEAMIANPLLGLGPAHFAYAYNGEGAHPHNFWLQLAAEWVRRLRYCLAS